MHIISTITGCSLGINSHGENSIPMASLFSDLEKKIIYEMLEKTGGNKTAAARNLMLNRTTLIEKCRKHGIPLKKANSFRGRYTK